MPKNWKYIKKLLEKEFLCEKLRGHITYDLTEYKPAPWYQQHFIMKYDDEVLLDVSQPEFMWDKRCTYQYRVHNYKYRVEKQAADKYDLNGCEISGTDIKKILDDVLDMAIKTDCHYSEVYGVSDIIGEIGTFLHSSINECLDYKQDYFLNVLAILDRRCGKRRLNKIASDYHTGLPKWAKRICQIRFEVEGIKYGNQFKIAKTSNGIDKKRGKK